MKGIHLAGSVSHGGQKDAVGRKRLVKNDDIKFLTRREMTIAVPGPGDGGKDKARSVGARHRVAERLYATQEFSGCGRFPLSAAVEQSHRMATVRQPLQLGAQDPLSTVVLSR